MLWKRGLEKKIMSNKLCKAILGSNTMAVFIVITKLT